ncbi:MAG: hypothetical protein IT323_03530, partial [Anaerolineae bacterium]|nr:hypothetical protein [Anaerolineae bacterium]
MPPGHDDTAQIADSAPGYPLAGGSLAAGYGALAARLWADGAPHVWRIDGMTGVDFGALERGLQRAFGGASVRFFRADMARLPDEASRARLDGDPEFGRLYRGALADVFDPAALAHIAQAARQAVADGRL